jgi:hypothetical protein
VLSTAIRNADTSSTDYNARNLYQSMGIKFSIVRGNLSRKTTALLESIHELQTELASGINQAIFEKLESDSIYQSLKKARQLKLAEKLDPDHAEVLVISQKMEKRLEKIKAGVVKTYTEELASVAENRQPLLRSSAMDFLWILREE